MAERFRRHSALAHLGLEARAATAVGDAGVVLGESRIRGLLALRGDAASPRFRSVVRAAIGLEPVVEPLTAARKRDVAMLWLGPDEWLVVTPDRRIGRVERSLRDALEGQHAALTDVSHSRAVLLLSGAGARGVLAKGCPIDFHPRVFGPGRCVQSRLAKCQVLIHQTDEAPSYEIYVNRSFAHYAWTWLEDAGEEFGIRVLPAE